MQRRKRANSSRKSQHLKFPRVQQQHKTEEEKITKLTNECNAGQISTLRLNAKAGLSK